MARTAPISQVQIEQELLRMMDMLEQETEAFEKLAEDSAKKEAQFKANWAKEYLSAKGSIKEREAWADYKMADLNYDYKIAEALVKSKREKLISLRTSMDSLRTLNANVRVQV
jgi:predicted  nucleic acid-binding Zn-ribbon protein